MGIQIFIVIRKCEYIAKSVYLDMYVFFDGF